MGRPIDSHGSSSAPEGRRPRHPHRRQTVAGVEAVVDKDQTADRSAKLSTPTRCCSPLACPPFESDFGHPASHPIRQATPGSHARPQLPAGSTGPKINATCYFVEHTGHTMAIGALDDTGPSSRATAGTIITTGGTYPGHNHHRDLAASTR